MSTPPQARYQPPFPAPQDFAEVASDVEHLRRMLDRYPIFAPQVMYDGQWPGTLSWSSPTTPFNPVAATGEYEFTKEESWTEIAIWMQTAAEVDVVGRMNWGFQIDGTNMLPARGLYFAQTGIPMPMSYWFLYTGQNIRAGLHTLVLTAGTQVGQTLSVDTNDDLLLVVHEVIPYQRFQ